MVPRAAYVVVVVRADLASGPCSDDPGLVQAACYAWEAHSCVPWGPGMGCGATEEARGSEWGGPWGSAPAEGALDCSEVKGLPLF